ncbi:hypothetical protein FG051_00370 [Companilactobacillus futsaii]|uniref:Uncharacterized protein n=1 Tax=Companilactobacillus futsaii TaxID=938155 RepID=A0A5B7T6R5_9LACO|nr:hypothetical protein FG051_00370 [Companilactobacillus futsaii]
MKKYRTTKLVRNSKENWFSSEIILSNLLLRIRPSLKTLPGFGLSKGSKSCPLRSAILPLWLTYEME